MIDVKGFRSEQTEKDPTDPLNLREQEIGKLKFAAGWFGSLIAVGLYLRSFLWSEAEAAPAKNEKNKSGDEDGSKKDPVSRSKLPDKNDEKDKTADQPAEAPMVEIPKPDLFPYPAGLGSVDTLLFDPQSRSVNGTDLSHRASNASLPPFKWLSENNGTRSEANLPNTVGSAPSSNGVQPEGMDGDQTDASDQDAATNVPDRNKNKAPTGNGPVYLKDVGSAATAGFALTYALPETSQPDAKVLEGSVKGKGAASFGDTSEDWQDFIEGSSDNEVVEDTASDGVAIGFDPAITDPSENIYIGTEFNDLIVGTQKRDFIDGRGGDDNLAGLSGDDHILGGDGNDNIAGGNGNDYLFGGAGNDVIAGGAGNDFISGGSGHDRLYGEAGDDEIYGDEGDDEAFGGEGNDSVFGGEGDDAIWGGTGDDVLSGDAGDDVLYGEEGRDVISGGNGDDIAIGGDGDDLITGGAGDDNLNGGSGKDILKGDVGNDALTGGDGDDIVTGGEGDDAVRGGEGDDVLSGDAGNDEISGDAGDDVIHAGDGNDYVTGGAGKDQIHGGAGDDVISGGEGDDVIYGDAESHAVYSNLGEDLIGASNDVRAATPEGNSDNQISNSADNRTQENAANREMIRAGEDRNAVFGAHNSDRLLGGESNDVIRGAAKDTKIAVSADADGIPEGSGNDVIDAGSGDDTVYGGLGDDQIDGGAGDDLLSGGAGRDTLDGGAGRDTLFGGSDEDTVFGGDGDDLVLADDDGADDVYDGGEGQDQLDYSAASTGIKIDLVEGTASGESAGNDSFENFEKFIGSEEDDLFYIAEGQGTLTGGGGSDVYNFVQGDTVDIIRSIYEITDFDADDEISFGFGAGQRQIRDAQRSIEDRIEDGLEEYADDHGADEPRLTYHHDWTDTYRRTVIEVDFDRDDIIDLELILEGEHTFAVEQI